MTVAPGDFVKVTYHGREIPVRDKQGQVLEVNDDTTTPLVLQWDSRRYEIPVGGSAFVPFDAMSNAAGDPRAGASMRSYRDESGNTGFILDRATEVRRLRTRYDNQMGDEEVIYFAPRMTVVDLEDNLIRTVLDDPSGESVLPITTTLVDRDALLAQVQRQQRMIEMLADQQGIDLNSTNLDVAVDPNATNDDLDSDGASGDEFATSGAGAEIPEDTK